MADSRGAFDVRRLQRLVKDRKIGHLEIKRRGVSVDLERVRKQLNFKGDNRATLIRTLPSDTHDGRKSCDTGTTARYRFLAGGPLGFAAVRSLDLRSVSVNRVR
jgi:hypothetical protein